MMHAGFCAKDRASGLARLLSIAASGILGAVAVPHANAPSVHAIRSARIVTAAGTTIDSGTIVIRSGRIEAVGASVAAPPDADVIDGKGLTVYPGLIDLGNVRAADQPPPQQPQGLRTTAEVERWKRSQILRPHARAADLFKVDSAVEGHELTTKLTVRKDPSAGDN